MLKKFIAVLMFFGVFYAAGVGGVFATEKYEEEQEQIQSEREAIQSELSEAEVRLVELVQEMEELNSEISQLDDIIGKNEQRIEEIENNIKNNEEEIKDLEAEVERLQNDIDYRTDLLRERARTYQHRGVDTATYIEVVLGSESFGDFVSRVVSITRIAEADDNFITQLELNQEELVLVQGQYEDTLYNLVNQAIELEEIHEQLEEQRDKTVQLRDQSKANEAEQEKLIGQLMKDDRDLAIQEEDIRKLIEEEARLQAEREAELAAQAKAEEEAAKKRAEEEAAAQAKAEEEAARAQAEEEKAQASAAQAKAEEDKAAKKKAEEEAAAQAKAEEEAAKKRAEEEARKKAEEQQAKKESGSNNSEQVSRSNSGSGSGSSQNNSSGSNSDSDGWRSFSATAYTASCNGCSGVTRTGIDLKANPNAKVIAVDPSVIPLGSRVEVKGYGTFLAADTGGAIKGNKIDIFMPNRSDALAFGRRSVEIRVVD